MLPGFVLGIDMFKNNVNAIVFASLLAASVAPVLGKNHLPDENRLNIFVSKGTLSCD